MLLVKNTFRIEKSGEHGEQAHIIISSYIFVYSHIRETIIMLADKYD